MITRLQMDQFIKRQRKKQTNKQTFLSRRTIWSGGCQFWSDSSGARIESGTGTTTGRTVLIAAGVGDVSSGIATYNWTCLEPIVAAGLWTLHNNTQIQLFMIIYSIPVGVGVGVSWYYFFMRTLLCWDRKENSTARLDSAPSPKIVSIHRSAKRPSD